MLITREKAAHVNDRDHREVRLGSVLRVGTQTTSEERHDKGLRCLGDDVIVQVFPAGQCLLVAHRQCLIRVSLVAHVRDKHAHLMDRVGGATCIIRVDGDARAKARIAI